MSEAEQEIWESIAAQPDPHVPGFVPSGEGVEDLNAVLESKSLRPQRPALLDR